MALGYLCAQVWPNLAADVMWTVPAWFWHKLHLQRMLAEQRAHITRELRDHRAVLDSKE